MKLTNIDNLSQIKWACRRGMLELDVLLGDFLNAGYAGLSPKEKHFFLSLLGEGDKDLFAWLLGQSNPEDPSLAHIVMCVRNHARSKFPS